MKNIRDSIDGDLTVNIKTCLKGIVTGNITVKANGTLLIDGGLVNGNIFNSGECIVNGMINGLLFTESGKCGFSRNGYVNAHQL